MDAQFYLYQHPAQNEQQTYVMCNVFGWWEWDAKACGWVKFKRKTGVGAGRMVTPSTTDSQYMTKKKPLEALLFTGYSVDKANKFNARDL